MNGTSSRQRIAFRLRYAGIATRTIPIEVRMGTDEEAIDAEGSEEENL